MESHYAVVSFSPSEVFGHALDQQLPSPRSSISSMRFASPSDGVSLTSAFEENGSTYQATSTLKSPIPSEHDTYTMMDHSCEYLAPEMAHRYPRNSDIVMSGSVFELPPVHEGDSLSIGTVRKPLARQSTWDILRRTSRLEVRIRRRPSELGELAVAVSQSVPIEIVILFSNSRHPRLSSQACTSDRDIQGSRNSRDRENILPTLSVGGSYIHAEKSTGADAPFTYP